jgi:hypothetical protein
MNSILFRLVDASSNRSSIIFSVASSILKTLSKP